METETTTTDEETWPRTVGISIHLRDGGSLDGVPGPVTEAEFTKIKDVMGDLLGSSGAWQVNLETPDGWVIVPKDSVNYLTMWSASA